MAAVPGRRGGQQQHQRSNSTPHSTATRNNRPSLSSTSTNNLPTNNPLSSAASTTTQHKLVSKSSVTSTSSTNTNTTTQSGRRRLSSTRRNSSSTTQSGLVSPLSPSISISGRRDSTNTIVSALTSPIVPNKRHSLNAVSLDPTTKARSSGNPLPTPSTSSTVHTRRSSTGTTTTSSRKVSDPATKSSRVTSSTTSRPNLSSSSSAPAAPPRTGTSPNSKSQPPVTRTTHKRANSASVLSRAITHPNTALPPSLPSVPPPSAPSAPEASSTGIPPHIQAELNKNASIQLSQPQRRPRAPARFSTNGIATANAPPPSLAYRQLPLAAPSPPPPAIPPPPLAPQPPPPKPSVEDGVEDFKYPPPLEEETSTALVPIEVYDDYSPPPEEEEDEDEATMASYDTNRFARTNGGLLNNGMSGQYNARVEDDEPTLKDVQRIAQQERSFSGSPEPSLGRSPGSQVAEDPFLSLARSSTPRSQALLDAQARQERRRSRMMQYSVNSGRTSGLSNEYSGITSTRQRGTASTTISDDSFGGVELSQGDAPYKTPGDPGIPDVDHSLSHRSSFLRRQREGQNGHARSISEIPRTTITRASDAPSIGRSGISTNNAPKSSISSLIEGDRAQNTASARLGVNDDVQSTISSGTVWDELDELKLRIKRLELTGTLPPASSSLSGVGSGISNSSGDRPRTGTTAATTISNSPRHQNQQINDAASTNGSVASGPPPTIHPVLHAALAKTKTVLPEHIIKALDALANDTLTLAGAVGSTGASAMSISAALNSPEKQLVNDRQVRRKVDNICRSLTELCIALADGRMPFEAKIEEPLATQPVDQQPQIQQPPIQQQVLPQQVYQPRIEDPIERTSTAFDFRSPSAIGHRIDREATVTPNSAARAHARFEARRASILGAPSPQYIARQASPSPQPVANRLSHRNSMSLRNQRGGVELEDELEVPQAPFRSPSRASTDHSNSRPQASPMRADFSNQGYDQSPLQRTLTLREQRAQQNQGSPNMGNVGLPTTAGLQHRRHYSTANVTPPHQGSGLGLGIQRRSYLDRERGISDGIGTAVTTVNGLGNTSAQGMDIGRRRTEYLRNANQEQDMSGSPPTSITGRTRTASVSRVGSVRNRTGLLGSSYTGRVDTGLGLGRDRVLNTTRR